MTVFRHWKSIYLACSLVFVSWVIHVGEPEFKKINRQYRALVNQLEPDRIGAVTMEALDAECRRKSWQRETLEESACSSWSLEVVATKENKVKEHLEQARKRGLIKVVLFYVSFVVIFLLAPPLLLYLFILGIITLYQNIKIVR